MGEIFMLEKKVSASVIKRLPRYYRYLGELCKSGTERISSKDLSEKMGVTASQIRQDLNCFGGFGQQGYGYNVKYLYGEIGAILGLENGYTAILVGAGNMGRAFAVNTNFEKRGFKLVGIFDNDPQKIGDKIKDLAISDYAEIEDFVKENKPTMAIIAVSKNSVGEVVTRLKSCGIKAFLNFTYTEFNTNDDSVVENIHLGDSLMRLCFKISEKSEKNEKSGEELC